MESIAIVGVGLIGGSLGLALKRNGFTGRIVGVSSPKTIESALTLGVIDSAATLKEAAQSTDVIYLAQPIGAILETIDLLGNINIQQPCLITDAGSTKSVICERAATALKGVQFLGGHPMAGKETRGVTSADASLFQDRTYVFSPYTPEEMYTPLASAFVNWTKKIGARTVTLSPLSHDRTVALTSHLPQLLSTALGVTLADELTNSEQFPVSGAGLQDMTRLAFSSYDIWRDILTTNRTEICHALDVYIDKLTEMRENFDTQQLGEDFLKAAGIAGKIRR